MDYEEEKEAEILSRSGYVIQDMIRAFQQALTEASVLASGKLIHYAADMVCSGGLSLFERVCMDYAFDHIGTASPRVFFYLVAKFKELRDQASKHPFAVFCQRDEVQQITAEIVLVLQGCPKKAKVKFPTIPAETHRNEGWLRSMLRTTDKAAVRKVFQRQTDQEEMLHAANEMVYSIVEGATESALFWAKWLQEEDAMVRKLYQSGLSTAERGPSGIKSQAQKTAVGYYLVAVLAELYKEYSQKGMVRFHQEFQCLLDMYRVGETKQKRKQDIIGLMIELLIVMPRMRVPAVPPLVKDPAVVQRMVEQAGTFFREVLYHPLPAKMLPATVTKGKRKKTKEPSKEEQLMNRLSMIDQVAMNFYKI